MLMLLYANLLSETYTVLRLKLVVRSSHTGICGMRMRYDDISKKFKLDLLCLVA